MNVSIEKIDNVNGKITVSIEENDYKDKVTSELKRIGKTHTLPGFRKGHVTIDQLRRRFGKQVKSCLPGNRYCYHPRRTPGSDGPRQQLHKRYEHMGQRARGSCHSHGC